MTLYRVIRLSGRSITQTKTLFLSLSFWGQPANGMTDLMSARSTAGVIVKFKLIASQIEVGQSFSVDLLADIENTGVGETRSPASNLKAPGM